MTGDLAGVLADVRALWHRNRALLWPLSGLFVFVPQFALLLLVPAMPDNAPGGTVETWSRALEPWIARYGGWYVVATLLAQYGALAVVSTFMAPAPTVAQAMIRALRLFPRAILAGLLVAIPCGVAALTALSVPFLRVLVLPAIVYILARAALTNPVILGERPIGAAAALVRSWQLTRGRGLPVALLVGAITIGGQAVAALVVSLDRGVRANAAADPVLPAAIDAVAAGVTWGAALMLALVQVALYQRLAR